MSKSDVKVIVDLYNCKKNCCLCTS